MVGSAISSDDVGQRVNALRDSTLNGTLTVVPGFSVICRMHINGEKEREDETKF